MKEESGDKEFKEFSQKLIQGIKEKEWIDYNKGFDMTLHTLNLFKSKKMNWNEICLLGLCLVDLSLNESINSIDKEDKNSKYLKNFLKLSRISFKDVSNQTKELMLLSSSYNGNPLNKIDVNISDSKMISLNLKKRFNLLMNYEFKCAYCGRSPPEVFLELEHIIPKSKGGEDIEENFVPACFDCNSGKRSSRLKNFKKIE